MRNPTTNTKSKGLQSSSFVIKLLFSGTGENSEIRVGKWWARWDTYKVGLPKSQHWPCYFPAGKPSMALHFPSYKGPLCSGTNSPFWAYPPLFIHSSTEQNVWSSYCASDSPKCWSQRQERVLTVSIYSKFVTGGQADQSLGCLIGISTLHVQNWWSSLTNLFFPQLSPLQ